MDQLERENEGLRSELESLRSRLGTQQSPEPSRQLFEHAADLVTLVDSRGNFLYVNEAGESAFGCSTKDLLGLPAFGFVHPEDREPTRGAFAGWVRDRVRTASFQNRQVDRQGNVRTFLWTVLPRYDVAGEIESVWSIGRDITERASLEERLKSALEELGREKHLSDAIIDSTPGVFYVLDSTGGFLRWNENMQRLTGLTRQEMAAVNALDLFAGDDQQRIAAAIGSVFEVGQAVVEAKLLHRSGVGTSHVFTGRKVEFRGEPRLVGVGIDISDRIAKEDALHERIKELRCLYRVSATVSSDLEDEALFREVVAGLPEGLQHPQLAEAAIRIDEAIYATGPAVDEVPDARRLTGAVIARDVSRGTVEVWYRAPPESGGPDPFLPEERALIDTIARMLGAAIERRETDFRFRRLIESAPIPMCLVNANEELAFPNTRFRRTFGYTPEDVPTLTEWWQRAYPDDAYRNQVFETWSAAVAKAAAEGVDIESHEYRITCKDGRVLVMEISGVVIGNEFLTTFIDQTARRKAEAELRRHRDELELLVSERTETLRSRTVALEASNRELEAFAYSVSHDLRTPLRSIVGFSHALLEDYHEALDDTGREYLERSADAARRMGQLIDDLLTLSRVTRTEMTYVEVDVSGMALEITKELRASDPTREVEVDVADGIWIFGDCRLVRRVLSNILDNAWKFTDGCPAARIEVGRVEREGVEGVFIRDNGAGFDMAYAEKLFVPFHRLHKDSEFHGTGIGLSIVQRIIARHGGEIRADSEPGCGATFYFSFPNRVDTEARGETQ